MAIQEPERRVLNRQSEMMLRAAKEEERETGQIRLRVLLAFFLCLALVVVARLVYIQVYNSSFYQQKARDQWQRESSLSAQRGRILDERGVVLAQSGTAYTIKAEPKKIKTRYKETTARQLSDTLNLNYNNVLRLLSSEAEQVNIKRQVSDEEAENVEKLRLTGVSLSMETRRNYPLNEMAAQLIGYTDLDGNGQTGLEGDYNKELAGVQGKIVSERNAAGRELPYGIEQRIPPVDGSNIVLTLNVVTQALLEEVLLDSVEANNAVSAQGIAMNIKTGEVIAMGTQPGPNLNRLDRGDMERTNSLMRNRVVLDGFAPGHSFGIVTASAALNAGLYDLDSAFECDGYMHIDGEHIRVGHAHGEETFKEALERGCESVLSRVSGELGVDLIYEQFNKLGFGAETQVGIGKEGKGSLLHSKYVSDMQIMQMGYGEGIGVTPMQYAAGLCALLNKGHAMQPYLIKQVVKPGAGGGVVQENGPLERGQVLSETQSAALAGVYEDVMRSELGKNAYIPGYRVGGAPGIAKRQGSSADEPEKYVASFFAFAPVDDPQYLVLVVVDSPEISTLSFARQIAAPAARTVLHNILRQRYILPDFDQNNEVGINLNVEIPELSGLSVEAANDELAALNLQGTANGTGTVIAQIPKAGQSVPEKTGVLLYTTATAQLDAERDIGVTVPDLRSMYLYQAYKNLYQWGLEVQGAGPRMGVVNGQNPAPGTVVPPGTVVYISLILPESR